MVLAGLHDVARANGAAVAALAAPALAARVTGAMLGGGVSGSALKQATCAIAAWIANYPAVRWRLFFYLFI